MGLFNSVWKIIKPNPRTLVVFLILFVLSDIFVGNILKCIELCIGFGSPLLFYFGDSVGSEIIGPYIFYWEFFIFDLIFWYLISIFLVVLFRKLIRR